MSRKFVCLIIFLVLTVTLVGALFMNQKSDRLITEVSHEVQEMPLIVQGKFPQWLDGTLVRNSSIPVYKEGVRISHNFDGIAMLHSFTFDQGNVSYTNRFLLSDAYDSVINKDSADYDGFASTQSFWKKVRGYFVDSSKWVMNASVNIFKYGNEYVALTEAPGPARFDLKTLETLGTFAFQDNLPKSKCFESAHPHLDFTTKETLNYLIEFGRNTHYVLYRMTEGSSTREMVGKIPVEEPAYMHSFAMTEHYLILTEFPFVINPIDLLIGSGSYIDHFKWKPEQGTRFIVIERSTGKVVSQAITEPFFSWHHANAYESKNDLIIDLVAFPDLSMMTEILPQASAKTNKQPWLTRLMRYHYSLKKAEITSEVLLEKVMEFPRIDDRMDGKPYRYLYFTLSNEPDEAVSMTDLGKFDLETKVLTTWNEPGYTVLEPIFVPSPESQSEDDGIVLTVIHDQKKENAFLVALDGRTFKEIARAKMPWHIPSSFHGQYFSESTFRAM